MYRVIKQIISGLLLLLGATGEALCATTAQEPDENFVIASVMIASPGEELYSKLGHAFLRMQCPSHDMDFCFTYESEDAEQKVFSFLSGKLRMGMQGVKTSEFLKHYAESGRRVTQYDLNLPIKVKQNLWRILDGKVDEGMELPYDYMERGCAYSVFKVIEEALGNRRMQIANWPEDMTMTRREIVCSRLDDSPWTRLFLNIITNGEIDDDVAYNEKTITPETLILTLQNASVDGKPLIAGEKEMLPQKAVLSGRPWFTPMKFAILLLVLTLAGAILGNRAMLYVMLAIQTLLGIFVSYLLFFSTLCATESTWLIIPFNPLPIIFWKWRRYWMLPYAAVLLVWVLAISFGGRYLMDPPLIVLALSFATALAADSGRGIRMRERLKEKLTRNYNSNSNIKSLKA